VKHPLLKLGRLCYHSIKIIFFRYSKTLSVEIVKNGWRPAECQVVTRSPDSGFGRRGISGLRENGGE
ncbi:MAG: hypothetical protein U9Q37_07860, partial [Euryarchaeota archaeon]|nr:hypothetical protein [Euryarchaeota archaeon]